LHLRAGQWIVQHHWVPYNDWFSNSGMGKPWAAFSWLSEVVIYGLFSRLGLIGLLVYVYGLMLAIAAALHSLVRKFESRLAYSVALTALALLALAPSYTPRPWLFTILFFIIELNVLVSVRRSGNYRALLLLPALFALWANFHIQFVYGLFVLGIATLEDPINRLLRHRATIGDEETRPVPVRTMALITGACLVATMVNPYHARIYAVVFDIATSIGVYELLSELQPMQFRSIPDWLVLFLTLAAAFAFGRRRAINPFWGLLLLTGAFVSFRSGRDAWFVVIVAVVIIGREIAVSALREWMAEIGKRGKVKVSNIAKLKTILQIVGLSCMLFRWSLPIFPGIALPVFEIGFALTIVAAVLTLTSAISYMRAAWPDLRGSA